MQIIKTVALAIETEWDLAVFTAPASLREFFGFTLAPVFPAAQVAGLLILDMGRHMGAFRKASCW
jgi:hypothetical protein